MLLKNDQGNFSVLWAYSLQGPTTSCTLIVPRSLDRRTTPATQFCSIELLMYSHWVVFSLELPVSHITFPYIGVPVPHTFLSDAHAWQLFTKTSQDLIRLSLQLSVHSSCYRVEWCWLRTMREPLLPLGKWFRILPNVFSSYSVFPVHILQYLSFLYTRWCVPLRVMYSILAYDSIYESLFLVGNLRTSTRVRVGIIIWYAELMT